MEACTDQPAAQQGPHGQQMLSGRSGLRQVKCCSMPVSGNMRMQWFVCAMKAPGGHICSCFAWPCLLYLYLCCGSCSGQYDVNWRLRSKPVLKHQKPKRPPILHQAQ